MFTREQIEELRKKLALSGTKDTEFPKADSITGRESIPLVQDDKNKQLSLEDLVAYIQTNNNDFELEIE